MKFTKIAMTRFWEKSNKDIRLAFGDIQRNENDRYNTPGFTTLSSDANIMKDRYSNIKPYDATRVKLRGCGNDYINASKILLDEGSKSKEYIVCQGPKSNTTSDFWQMISEIDVQTVVIVMLTELAVGNFEKCYTYWKVGPEISDTNLRLTVKKQPEAFKGYQIATYDLSGKTVHHLWCEEWVDHSSPSFSVKTMIDHAQKLNKDNGPLVVHCSAGIGRSGTFVALDKIESMGADEIVNYGDDLIVDIVDKMRKQRPGMIQNERQFRYIYDETRNMLDGK